uniref:Uncharacterized protein n=2 Tax=Oryza sativa subsp. japonica TaxID=39947 RepID=Q7G4C7_ORYSJ|nr:hypothetical protein [Oryza sativa Japonica Group]AAP52654.1 hypothetical protein LOC_Os10g12380 [Oryza sativa Japonica Group]
MAVWHTRGGEAQAQHGRSTATWWRFGDHQTVFWLALFMRAENNFRSHATQDGAVVGVGACAGGGGGRAVDGSAERKGKKRRGKTVILRGFSLINSVDIIF